MSVKHGARYWLDHGRMPPGNDDVLEYLDGVRSRLIQEVAGSEDRIGELPALLINNVVLKLGALELLQKHAATSREDMADSNAMKMMIALSNAVSRDLEKLAKMTGKRGVASVPLYEQYGKDGS